MFRKKSKNKIENRDTEIASLEFTILRLKNTISYYLANSIHCHSYIDLLMDLSKRLDKLKGAIK